MDTVFEPNRVGEKSSSRPEKIPMSFRGFDQETAEASSSKLGTILYELGKFIDISMLDGVTIALDYDEALADLDRGYETIQTLTKTTEFGTGVAMTPAVLRDGVVKSHIVLNGGIAIMLEDSDSKNFSSALHTIAHECAHVEITAAYDRCFPGEMLKKNYDTVLDGFRDQVAKACWEEYAACRIASDVGHDPLPGYEDIFVDAHSHTDMKVQKLVRDFKGGNADALVGPVFGAYGDMMKFACYMLGSMAAAEKTLVDCKAAQAALIDHWFAPYFDRLNTACDELYKNLGIWNDKSGFEMIGDIVEEIIVDKIMKIWRHSDRTYTICIYPDVLQAANI